MDALLPVLITAGLGAAIVGAIHAAAHAIRVRSDAVSTAASVELQRENTDHALVTALIARVEAAERRAAALEARCFALESERAAIRVELDECERRSDAMRMEIRELYQVIQSVHPTKEQKR